MAFSISCAAKTDVGTVRTNNEDAWLADSTLGLYIVADGMGGHECGEVASAIAVETIHETIRNKGDLATGIARAHQQICRAAEEGKGAAGMGTTAVALQIIDNLCVLGWVGDSRIYRFNQKLEQVSLDHSYVQEMLDQHLITPEQARTHPQRSVLTRCLGSLQYQTVEADIREEAINSGDVYLLCSDGLSDLVTDEDIAQIMALDLTLDERSQALIDKALEQGGYDNVTVVLVAFNE